MGSPSSLFFVGRSGFSFYFDLLGVFLMPVRLEFAAAGQNQDLANRIGNAVFTTADDFAFIHEYVPMGARVPSAMAFANFAATNTRSLAGVIDDDQMVGFILISDTPHRNAIGFGIKRDFANQGIMTEALRLFFDSNGNENNEIIFPLNAYTSVRNTASQRLLERSGFERSEGDSNFAGERTCRYVRRN